MVATLARPSTTHAHQDDPRVLRYAPAPEQTPAAPTIDRAEALLLEVGAIIVRLDERERFDLGAALEQLAEAGSVSAARLPDTLAEFRAYVGPGNRCSDQMDRDDAARRHAAATYPAVVERYARIYHADGIDAAHRMSEGELVAAYGEELAGGINYAAFQLYLHQKHDHGPNRVDDDCLYCHDA